MPTGTSVEKNERHEQIFRAAEQLYGQNPDWVTFYREILGIEGIVRQVCKTPKQQEEFEQSGICREIHYLMRKLREKLPMKVEKKKSEDPLDEGSVSELEPKAVAEAEMKKAAVEPEPIQVITVRIPQSLHEALAEEAHQCRSSVNQLCISKLMRFIDTETVPSDRPFRRERKTRHSS